jgi:23S rRNA (uracil1939-C5)-methyltransferase
MNVTIEKLVYGGEGLGHAEGQTVFVPFVLPGEVVAVRPVERKKKFLRGHVQHVLTPSADRAMPPCPHFTACGGCNYQHIPYDAQLRYKAEILRETLWRIGRVRWEGEIYTHPSPPLGYRNRAQWKLRPAGGPEAASSRLSIGYFRAGSSALLPVDRCPILTPRLEEAFTGLRALAAEGRLPATLREVEAFCDSAGQQVLLNASLTTFDTSPADVARLLRAAIPATASVLLHESSRDRFELDGPGFIHYPAEQNRYRVGHLSFFQVNRFLVDEMVRSVTADTAGQFALDLFAGVGLFTLPLARNFARVVAVESNVAAARDLEENIKLAAVSAQPVTAEAERFLGQLSETPDLVVLDPPRAGVAGAALSRLITLSPPRIVYLSCDPSTLARDLAVLTGAASGATSAYRITELHLFDVFPQTFHIESLVCLHRT